ncbi:MAG: mannose-1-phosphate guanylyltransferase, partial [Gallionella sp.]|nr:mannose-1-phosphate guanylyltransferase [Gallionella sp.]
YSPEASALETAGGIANALPLLGDKPFAVINGDIYCDYDFTRLPAQAAVMQAKGDRAHLVLVDNPAHHPEGDFQLNGNRIVPTATQSSILNPQSSLLTFSGIGLYHPALFADIPRGSVAPLAPLLRAQIALGRVGGEHHRGLWIDVGTPQRLHELDSQLRANRHD